MVTRESVVSPVTIAPGRWMTSSETPGAPANTDSQTAQRQNGFGA